MTGTEIFLNQILYPILMALASAFVAALFVAVVKLIPIGAAVLKSRAEAIKDEALRRKVQSAIDDIANATTTIVNSLQQTIVGPLKAASEDGKLTPEEIQAITTNAVNEIKAISSDESMKILEEYKVDVEALIVNLIQERIFNMKIETEVEPIYSTPPVEPTPTPTPEPTNIMEQEYPMEPTTSEELLSVAMQLKEIAEKMQ